MHKKESLLRRVWDGLYIGNGYTPIPVNKESPREITPEAYHAEQRNFFASSMDSQIEASTILTLTEKEKQFFDLRLGAHLVTTFSSLTPPRGFEDEIHLHAKEREHLRKLRLPYSENEYQGGIDFSTLDRVAKTSLIVIMDIMRKEGKKPRDIVLPFYNTIFNGQPVPELFKDRNRAAYRFREHWQIISERQNIQEQRGEGGSDQ